MSYEMTPADLVWNRAAMEDGGESPALGDVALASLLYAHGLVMNGGVLHAVELLTSDELSDARDGYRFFGLSEVASLLANAKTLFDADDGLDKHESRLDREYWKSVPDDSSLVKRFEVRFTSSPSDFSPVR